MFTFHKPKVFRSANGCCICRAKSSSSRFTDSKRYEAYFEKCFSLEEQRSGEICNACVLLVKRYIKLPAGSTRHWNHVVDARSGPGIKSLVKSKKQKENNTSNRDENDTPEKINKKHFYRSKKKPAVVRKRNPSIPVSGFLDMSRWQKEKVCCGIIFRGPHGEVAIDPRFMKPCCLNLKAGGVSEPLAPLSSHNNNNQINKEAVAEEVTDAEMVETDDSASTTSNPTDSSSLVVTSSSAKAAASLSSKLVDEQDDEGFFDKPAVSPSESGTSTPPPTSDPETTDVDHNPFREEMMNTT